MKKYALKFSRLLFFLGALLLLNACGSQTQVQKTPVHLTPALTAAPTIAPTATPTPIVSEPMRLLIPRINVDAPVEDVGIATNGDLATPTKSPWENVGWYRNGTRPGEDGSAVINGHLDRPGGYPAVFWNLRYLRAGDIVTVRTAAGQNMNFRVLRLASYTPQNAPLQSIFATTGGVYLNLITCTGTWIPAQHQTTLRLVVYTVRV